MSHQFIHNFPAYLLRPAQNSLQSSDFIADIVSMWCKAVVLQDIFKLFLSLASHKFASVNLAAAHHTYS
eukprot:scaffold424412_cov19-Prasinocladus_malaysianus.AAC.1